MCQTDIQTVNVEIRGLVAIQDLGYLAFNEKSSWAEQMHNGKKITILHVHVPPFVTAQYN